MVGWASGLWVIMIDRLCGVMGLLRPVVSGQNASPDWLHLYSVGNTKAGTRGASVFRLAA